MKLILICLLINNAKTIDSVKLMSADADIKQLQISLPHIWQKSVNVLHEGQYRYVVLASDTAWKRLLTAGKW